MDEQQYKDENMTDTIIQDKSLDSKDVPEKIMGMSVRLFWIVVAAIIIVGVGFYLFFVKSAKAPQEPVRQGMTVEERLNALSQLKTSPDLPSSSEQAQTLSKLKSDPTVTVDQKAAALSQLKSSN